MAIKQQNSLKVKLADSLSPYYRVLSPIMKLNQLIIAACAAIATIITAAVPSIAYPARVAGEDPGSAVNMRSGPGKDYRILDTTSVGDFVNVISDNKDVDDKTWYKIEASGTVGWVRGDYIRRIATAE
jgi:uncharacterized protein YraI